jgi:hypothetical protein
MSNSILFENLLSLSVFWNLSFAVITPNLQMNFLQVDFQSNVPNQFNDQTSSTSSSNLVFQYPLINPPNYLFFQTTPLISSCFASYTVGNVVQIYFNQYRNRNCLLGLTMPSAWFNTTFQLWNIPTTFPVQYSSWNGLLLVFSNLAFISCVLILMAQSMRIKYVHDQEVHRKRYSLHQDIKIGFHNNFCKALYYFCNAWTFAWEISEYCLVTVISSLYHRCDAPGWDNCIVPWNALYFMDIYISFILFTSAVTPHLPLAFKHPYKAFMTLLTMGLVLYSMDDTTMTIVPLALLSGITFVAFNWKRIKRSNWTASTLWIIPAIVFLVVAVVMKFSGPPHANTTATGDEYAEKHAIWHMAAAVASSCLHLFLDPFSKMYTSDANERRKSNQKRLSKEPRKEDSKGPQEVNLNNTLHDPLNQIEVELNSSPLSSTNNSDNENNEIVLVE